jgi:hypothetical protein
VEFDALSAIVGETLAGIAALPVLPSEAEDILAISSRERHKWLDDRSPSERGHQNGQAESPRQGRHIPRIRASLH